MVLAYRSKLNEVQKKEAQEALIGQYRKTNRSRRR